MEIFTSCEVEIDPTIDDYGHVDVTLKDSQSVQFLATITCEDEGTATRLAKFIDDGIQNGSIISVHE